MLRSDRQNLPTVDARYREIEPVLVELAGLLPQAIEMGWRLLEPYRAKRFPLQPIHGDARPEHFLMTGSALTGLIDFGAMRGDTPLFDVARLAGELALGDTAQRSQIASEYDPAIDQRLVAAIDLSSAVISAHNWAGWLAPDAGRGFEVGQVSSRLRSLLYRVRGQLVCGLGW